MLDVDVDIMTRYPMYCPACHKNFKSSGGTASHLAQAANCQWWLTEQKLQENRQEEKGKGKMYDPASADDYSMISVPQILVEDDPELEEDDYEPDEALDEFDEEELFHLLPGIPPEPFSLLGVDQGPAAGPGCSSTIPPTFSSPRKTNLTLDDSADSRHSIPHPDSAFVIATDKKLHAKWAAAFGHTVDSEGDVDMTSVDGDTPNPYLPFASELDWQIAKWFVKEDPGHAAFDRLLKIPGVVEKLGLSFKNVRQIHKTLDDIPERSGRWKAKILRYPDRPNEKFIIRYRNPIEVIKSLWADPSLSNDLVFAPCKVYSNMSRKERVYSEMWTGNWWNTLQGKLAKGATIAPVIIATDKTHLTQFSGSKSAYPVYLTIGNIPKAIRRKPTRHACILLGYLSPDKINPDGLTKKELKCRGQRLFHDSMRHILSPLIEAGTKGVKMTDGKGDVRRVFPILASYVADYPEQCLVACAKNTTCPKCQAEQQELQSLEKSADRTSQWTLERLADAEKSTPGGRQFHDYCLQMKVAGGVYEPFWKGFPYADIHMAITPDVLHQLYQGVLSMLTEWCQSAMSEKELDRRMQKLPPCYGVRHFGKGISVLSQVSGSEHKSIGRILLACLLGKMSKEALLAARHLLDFIYLAQYQTHDDDTLQYLQDALQGFHDHRQIFIEIGCREHFNIPKYHSMTHYVESIKRFGTTDNYNTEMFERLHIDFAKEAWRASNKRNEFPQMIDWLSRQEKLQVFDNYVKEIVTFPSKDKKPTLAISLAKFPNASRSMDFIIQQHRSPNFTYHLRDYLNSLAPRGSRKPKSTVPDLALPFDTLNVWHMVRMVHEGIADDAVEEKDHIKAIPATDHPPHGRFDPAIVLSTAQAESTGLPGTKIARVKVIFALPSTISAKGTTISSPAFWPKEPLAYGEWYSPPSGPNPTTLFYQVHPQQRTTGGKSFGRLGGIVPLSTIRQSCMLTPKWDAIDDTSFTSDTVLDQDIPLIINNFSTNFAYQSIW
ncbi:hypothetical protein PTI98_005719 [Pleurotus ostreatus]|nr:hypothetical protein PTI98_005719 [Pleurotus ostreatus]